MRELGNEKGGEAGHNLRNIILAFLEPDFPLINKEKEE